MSRFNHFRPTRTSTAAAILTQIFLLSLFITGCNREKAAIQADPDELAVRYPQSSFTVHANVAWQMSQTGEHQFSVTPTSGVPGQTVVTVQYLSRLSGKPVQSELNLYAQGASAQVRLLQEAAAFSLSQPELVFGPGASMQTVQVTSNTSWEVDRSRLPSWIQTVSTDGNDGNGTITVAVKACTNRKEDLRHTLQITYAGLRTAKLEILQQMAPNNPPAQPQLVYPQNNAADVSNVPVFKWKEVRDPDGDAVRYSIQLSADGKDWKEIAAGDRLECGLPEFMGMLQPLTRYRCRLVADDGNFNGKTASEVCTFTTVAKDAYADGEYAVYQQSVKETPCVLIFTGDGYRAEHFRYGDLFDQDADAAIEGIFSMEPYRTYREYFTVYKIAAYSNETGITDLYADKTKDTKFGLMWKGGNSTGLSSPKDGKAILEWCRKIPGITDTRLQKCAVGVISNADIYAGTCLSYSNGKSIAMIARNRHGRTGGRLNTRFENVVCHEMGGHGFGRLADEYDNYESEMPASDRDNLLMWQRWGYSRNVSAFPLMEDAPWSMFQGQVGYAHVSMYEGGRYYAKGVWRPEKVSCMIDNRLYFNSPSRYFIVERIMQIAGEDFSFDKFVSKDVQKTDPALTKSLEESGFKPLGRPVYIVEE